MEPTESDAAFAEHWKTVGPCLPITSWQVLQLHDRDTLHAAVAWAGRRDADELRRRAPIVQRMIGRLQSDGVEPSGETIAGLFLDAADHIAAGLSGGTDATTDKG